MPEYIAPRGTRDILPGETAKWQYLETKFREICALCDFKEIRTPTFEHTELFTRNLGETTDVVSKEMYTFDTKGSKSLTLRPEGTAPAIRAYVQHNLGANLPVNKLYYIARLFRYERPQAGRYREHTQLGIEAVGSCDPAIDAEVIGLAARFLKSVGIEQLELKLNSIGCPECRPKYRQALMEFAKDKLEKLCPTCVVRYEQNPLRMLDCKVPECKAALEGAPRMVDYLCDDCAGHFAKVQEYIKRQGIVFELDPRLVRGFDYYTKTAFEIVSSQLGSQNAIVGGGRYDNLVKDVGGPDVPGIGFGMGLDRLTLALESLGIELPVDDTIKVFVAGMGEAGHDAAVDVTWRLREAGIAVDMDYTGRSLKAQMKVADKLGAKYVVILGEDEIASQAATVRNMATSEQKTVPLAELAMNL